VTAVARDVQPVFGGDIERVCLLATPLALYIRNILYAEQTNAVVDVYSFVTQDVSIRREVLIPARDAEWRYCAFALCPRGHPSVRLQCVT